MKLSTIGTRGWSLMELLVYMAIFVIVVGCATATFFKSWDYSKSLRANADDIARAIDVGERWRADVRSASSSILPASGGELLRIPCASGEVLYSFTNGEIRRAAGQNSPETIWLRNAKSSQMQSEMRGGIAVWRWELELKSEKGDTRVRPLFSFEAVAGNGANK
jgi:type II secretory pathway pseudopilin PulG